MRSSLGYSGHEMVKFEILRAVGRSHNKLTFLELRRADFVLLRYSGRV